MEGEGSMEDGRVDAFLESDGLLTPTEVAETGSPGGESGGEPDAGARGCSRRATAGPRGPVEKAGDRLCRGGVV